MSFISLGCPVKMANFLNPISYSIKLKYKGKEILGMPGGMGIEYKAQFRIKLSNRSPFNLKTKFLSSDIFSTGVYLLIGNYLARNVESENVPDTKEKAHALLEDLYAKMQVVEKGVNYKK